MYILKILNELKNFKILKITNNLLQQRYEFSLFFISSAVCGLLFISIWLPIFLGIWQINLFGNNILWHAHELIFGCLTAAILGFLLTAIPEFTNTYAFNKKQVIILWLLWISQRITFSLSALTAFSSMLWLTLLLAVATWMLLLKNICPVIFKQANIPNLSFVIITTLFAVVQCSFLLALIFNANALSWLRLSVGLIMVLLIMAISRISMSVVNQRLQVNNNLDLNTNNINYLARPPRRNLAILCIIICSLCEFFLGHNAVTGFCALATVAAILNLLNDWHIGSSLFKRLALLLYLSYWLMAAGYLLMALAWFDFAINLSSGRHVLVMGCAFLAIFVVFSIIGKVHANLPLDNRLWLPIVAFLLLVATIARALFGVWYLARYATIFLWCSTLLWLICCLIYLIYNLKDLLKNDLPINKP